MPIRGENIGTAYVRIVGDGSGLPDDVRDAFDESEPSVREGAKSHGEVYDKEFRKELRKGYKEAFGKDFKSVIEDLNKNLTKGMTRLEFADRFFRTGQWQKFRKRLEAEGGAAGSLLAKRLEDSFRESGDLNGLERAMLNYGPALRRAQRDILVDVLNDAANMNEQFNRDNLQMRLDYDREFEEQAADLHEKFLSDQFRMDREFEERAAKLHADYVKEGFDLDRQFEEFTAEMHREVMQERDDLDREFLANHRKRAEEHAALVTKVTDNMKLLNHEMGQLTRGDRNAQSRGDLRRVLDETRDAAERAGVATKSLVESLDDHDRTLRRTRPRLDGFIHNMDRLGDGVGRAFGKGSRNNFINFIGSVAGGLTGIIGTVARAAKGFMNFGASISEAFAKEGFSGGLKALLGSLGSAAAVSVVGIAALVAILGPLISALSLAAGAVIALASSLTMGLIGAVGAAAGALGPLVFGIGAAVLAFKNMDEETKKAFVGIADAVSGLGPAAARGLRANGGIIPALHEIRNLASGMEPLFANLGEALGSVIRKFPSIAGGPFTKFIDAIDGGNGKIGFMARQVEKMGDAFSNFLGGALGFFRGLMPTVDRFTTWIGGLASDFNAFANSASGQTKIRSFFDDAADSAAAFGSLLGGIWEWLGAVIQLGNEAGDSMFVSLGDKFREWADYLNTPQGSAAFRGWMDDAKEFAESIGVLIIAFGKLIAALDNDLTRTLLFVGLEALQVTMDTLALTAEVMIKPFNDLATAIGKLFSGDISGGLVGSLTSLSQILLGPLAGGFSLFTGFMKKGVDEGAGDKILGINDIFKTLSGTIRNSVVPATEEAREAMRQLSREEVLNRLNKEGLVEVGNRLGVATRDLIDAALGNREAQKRVNEAMKEGGGYAEQYLAPRLRNLQEHYHNLQNTVEANRQNLASWAEALRGVPKEAQTEIKTLGFRPSMKQIADIQRQFRLTPKELRIAMQAVGYQPTRRQIRILTSDIKGIPKRIETRIENRGIPKTMAQLDKLFKAQKATREEIRSTVKALGVDKAWADFRKIQKAADDTDKKRPSPKVLITDEQFKRGMVNANKALTEFGKVHETAKVSVDPTDSNEVLRGVIDMLNKVTDRTATVTVNYRSTGKGAPATAAGGMFFGPQVRLIGEAGAEAVVPLNRNLSQVDPAVRWLSAIAQGKIEAMARGGVVGGVGKTVNVEQHIYSPQADPRAVASETVNRLVAVGY